jgi:hypothetical protein
MAGDTKINSTFQFVLWFSGFRGAMAFAIAIQASNKFKENDVGRDFLTLTVIYTCITIFIFGGALQMVIENFSVEASTMDRYDFDSKNCCDFMKIKFMEGNKKYLQKHITRKPEIAPVIEDANGEKFMDSPDTSKFQEDRVKKLKIELESIKICREDGETHQPGMGSIKVKTNNRYSKQFSQLSESSTPLEGKIFGMNAKSDQGPFVSSGGPNSPKNDSGYFFNQHFHSENDNQEEDLGGIGYLDTPQNNPGTLEGSDSKDDGDTPEKDQEIAGRDFATLEKNELPSDGDADCE